MKKLEIMTVCGFGIGSSLILKINIDSVLKAEGFDVKVEPCDITTAKSQKADLVFTSKEISSQLEGSLECPIIIIENFMSKTEIKDKALPFLKEILK